MRRIEGYVIVSADGMIADAQGVMPASIRNDADQAFFQAGLDRAAVIVHGRHSHEGGRRAARRKRLVVSRQVATTAPDPAYPNALFGIQPAQHWKKPSNNSALATVPLPSSAAPKCSACSCRATTPFTCRARRMPKIPGGRPVFNEVGPNATPEDVLMRHGLKPGPRRDLDAAAGVSLVTWER